MHETYKQDLMLGWFTLLSMILFRPNDKQIAVSDIVQPKPQWPHQVGPIGSHVNSCLFMIIRLEPLEIKCADLYSSLD